MRTLAHRHASGYVERDGPGPDGKPKHQHADGTVHDDHAVAANDWGDDEPSGWPPEPPKTLHLGPAKPKVAEIDASYD